MTRPPVTVAEFRDHLNLEDGEDVGQDEERWGKLVAATALVEALTGPIRPVALTTSQRPTNAGLLDLAGPILSIETITDADGNPIGVDTVDFDPDTGIVQPVSGYFTSRKYDVAWTAGYDPIPQALIDAVLVVAAQLWESQRGPSGTHLSSEAPPVSRGFAFPNRAKELVAPFRQVSGA